MLFMKTEIPMEQLLRWRLCRAEGDAPPVPRGARLLELARPWWEVLPERFEALLQRLSAIQVAYGHAMVEPTQSAAGHRVAVLIVRGPEELESAARILYFTVREGQLRLRFQLENAPADMPPMVEVTFICEGGARRPFVARACISVDNEYRLEAELPAEVVDVWEQLKVRDRMPFRFIIQTANNE